MIEPDLRSYERLSLILALAAPIVLAVMVYLVQIHPQNDVRPVAERFPLWEVFACVPLATGAAVGSIFFAIRPVVNFRFRSLFWVGPLIAGCCWFIEWYNWGGLFSAGKPW